MQSVKGLTKPKRKTNGIFSTRWRESAKLRQWQYMNKAILWPSKEPRQGGDYLSLLSISHNTYKNFILTLVKKEKEFCQLREGTFL